MATATLLKATTVQRLGLEDLVKKAHHIVAGKVRNSKTFWSLVEASANVRLDVFQGFVILSSFFVLQLLSNEMAVITTIKFIIIIILR